MPAWLLPLLQLGMTAAGTFMQGGKQRRTDTTTPFHENTLQTWARDAQERARASQDWSSGIGRYSPYNLRNLRDVTGGARAGGLGPDYGAGREGYLEFLKGRGFEVPAFETGRGGNLRSLLPRKVTPDPGSFVDPSQEFRDKYLDLLRGAMDEYAGGAGGGGGGFGIHIPNVHASHAKAHTATASLIDMLDKAFLERPPTDVREDVYTRLKGGAQAAAENERRKIGDAARLAGVGPNEPWVQALMAKADREAQKTSTQGLTDFFDSWVQSALGRRAGALGTNAELQTGVNTFNAGEQNRVGMFNASQSLAASQANAQAGYWRGLLGAEQSRLGLEGQRLRQGGLQDIMRNLWMLLEPQQRGSRVESEQGYEPGGGDFLGAAGRGVRDIIDWWNRRPNSGGPSDPFRGGFDWDGGDLPAGD